MTNNTHTIAAILVAQTPIGTRYALLDVPGTELTDAERGTPNHTPFTLAFEQSERELGERIGYPALVYAPKEQDATMNDLYTPWTWEHFPDNESQLLNCLGESIIEGSIVVESDTERQEIANLIVSAPALQSEIAALRADLDDARQHVGAQNAALEDVAAVNSWLHSFHTDVLNTAPEYIERCGDWNAVQYMMQDCDGIAERAASVLLAARAWLRRGAR